MLLKPYPFIFISIEGLCFSYFLVFVSGFFVNAILAMLLTFLGQKLNVDIYLAAIIVFIGRMFNNLGIIRRYCLAKISKKPSKK